MQHLLAKFHALKHLDISFNDLRLLPVGMLQFAARLDTFKCDNSCPLELPPQSFFSTAPDQNPRRIREFLDGLGSDTRTELKLSAEIFTSSDALHTEVVSLLELYPALQHLDLSDNSSLDNNTVSRILALFSGNVVFLCFIFDGAVHISLFFVMVLILFSRNSYMPQTEIFGPER